MRKTIKTEELLDMASNMVKSAMKHEKEGKHELALTEARLAYNYQNVVIVFEYTSSSDFCNIYDEVVKITKINNISSLVNEMLDRLYNR